MSLRKPAPNFIRNGQGLLDAGSDGRSAQIVTGKPDSGKLCPEILDARQAVSVTEIILRKRARPNRDMREDGVTLDEKDR